MQIKLRNADSIMFPNITPQKEVQHDFQTIAFFPSGHKAARIKYKSNNAERTGIRLASLQDKSLEEWELDLDGNDHPYYVAKLTNGNVIFAYGNPHEQNFKYSGLNLRIFNPVTKRYEGTPAGFNQIQAFTMSSDGCPILGVNKKMIVLDKDAKEIVREWEADVSALTVLPSGEIISGYGLLDTKLAPPQWKGNMTVWDPSGRCLKAWDVPTFSLISSSDGRFIISRGIETISNNQSRKLLSIWDVETGERISCWDDNSIHLRQPPLVILPGGQLINSPVVWHLSSPALDFLDEENNLPTDVNNIIKNYASVDIDFTTKNGKKDKNANPNIFFQPAESKMAEITIEAGSRNLFRAK
ncbi:MAG: hypothetical protein ACD_45C00296G0008 [uncultured bacterium]|nr:MAG: hypothetical protein ACD_45C00296G0008 [uncultured bacterium]